MIEALKARIKRLYAIRSETDLEPFVIDQPVAPPPQPARCCNNCDSHNYLLCPIHPLRKYIFSAENDCPDFTKKRSL